MQGLLIAAADRLESVGTRIKRRADRRRVVNRVSLAELEQRGWSGVTPTFVLSTGRCGTRLLTELLEASGDVAVHHSPRPELVRVSRRAWEAFDEHPEMFVEVVKTAREEMIHEAVRYGQSYVETNNRVTFLAPAIARAFPESRFIHLIRHPADIVRSGIRRGWYSGQHAHDLGRIVPRPESHESDGWDARDPIEKIGWMWQETNRFIADFFASLGDDNRHITSRAEDLFASADECSRLVRFCDVEPPSTSRLATLISRPVNAQKTGDFPTFDAWSDEQRSMLRLVAPDAARWGYEL